MPRKSSASLRSCQVIFQLDGWLLPKYIILISLLNTVDFLFSIFIITNFSNFINKLERGCYIWLSIALTFNYRASDNTIYSSGNFNNWRRLEDSNPGAAHHD